MKHKKPFLYIRSLLVGFVLAGLIGFALPSAASAAKVPCDDGTFVNMTEDQTLKEACKGHQTDSDTASGGSTSKSQADALQPSCPTSGKVTKKSGCTTNTTDAAVNCGPNQCDIVKKYVNPAINLIGALVGVAVVISIIMGAIQYSTSAGDPQQAAKARQRITMAIVALITYIFLYAFLQFILPGGLR